MVNKRCFFYIFLFKVSGFEMKVKCIGFMSETGKNTIFAAQFIDLIIFNLTILTMKIKLLSLLGLLLMATQAFAQREGNSGSILVASDETQYRQIYKSRVPVWLNLSAGGTIADCYDNGTIPYSYLGIGGNFGLGATVEWRRCHIQSEGRLSNTLLAVSGNAIGIDSKTEFLYRFFDGKRNRFHLWAGGAFQTNIDIKSISAMMNASTGVTGFINVCAEGMLSYDFAYIRGGSHNLLSIYGKLSLPMFSAVLRPGYAYMDNYSQDIDIINAMLEDYESFGMVFPGASTNVGLYFNLLNGNRIGLSYRWDYLTTRKAGVYRYDNALHSINLNFMFNIN